MLAMANSYPGKPFFGLLSKCILLGNILPLMTVTLSLLSAVFFIVQNVYLTTSRQLRLLDFESSTLVRPASWSLGRRCHNPLVLIAGLSQSVEILD